MHKKLSLNVNQQSALLMCMHVSVHKLWYTIQHKTGWLSRIQLVQVGHSRALPAPDSSNLMQMVFSDTQCSTNVYINHYWPGLWPGPYWRSLPCSHRAMSTRAEDTRFQFPSFGGSTSVTSAPKWLRLLLIHALTAGSSCNVRTATLWMMPLKMANIQHSCLKQRWQTYIKNTSQK